MISTAQQQRIESCYSDYCGIIKPLIANIEARSEKIPLPLFNEIRAFNDHIARCYYKNPSSKYIDEQIDRAERHISRIMLDCFKCLNVILYQRIECFDRQTRNIDLTVIDNGTFYPEYSRNRAEASKYVAKAKIAEATDTLTALELYQKAYNRYIIIVDSIDYINEKVKWARVRFTSRRILTIIGWVISILVSALISAYFSCEIISRFLN